MRVYLDHNATTPLREEVVDAMERVLRDVYGNPSSTHTEGLRARAMVERAREQVAALVHARPGEVVFTAGATEANNTVLADLAGPLVTTRIEHPSVLEPAEALESRGVHVVQCGVDAEGRVELAALEAALDRAASPGLVSVIWANNETGVIQPMREIAELARARGVPLHVDATQALGKHPVDLEAVPADYLAASAHKMNGPKGVGCLVLRRPLEPLLRGGPQERRRRGGTENVAAVVGYGVACELAARELAERGERYRSLRDRLWEGVRAKVPRVRRNGSSQHVLPNTLNVEFQDTAGEVLLQTLDLEGIAVSMGAACHSGSITPSHVLTAMGQSPEQARGALRFSVGHGVDETQIDRVLAVLPDLVARVRAAGDA
jgi:cysteine desulfurase